MIKSDALNELYFPEDELFDAFYPPAVRKLSYCHWTPIVVARRAAAYLVNRPGTKVLDVGCGPGKFCMIGALTSEGHFTGIEQRESLADLARTAIRNKKIPNVKILTANIADIDFSAYEAFYLFNPFEENLSQPERIDSAVELSLALYEQYIRHVCAQLTQAPAGTRVATYHGVCEEIPLSYNCQHTLFDGSLKLWLKTSD